MPRGVYPRTPETRRILSEAAKKRDPATRKHSEESRRKLSEAHKGKVMSKEARRNMSAAKAGSTHAPPSEETRRKISEALKGHQVSEATRLKLSEHRKNEVGYAGAHDRVISLRGLASEHSCVDCGMMANDWSYNHEDPDEKIDEFPYSQDPSFYDARCRRCHIAFDRR